MYPRVRIHMDRLRRNLDACAGIIQKVPGCTLMIVTKGVCAYPPSSACSRSIRGLIFWPTPASRT